MAKRPKLGGIPYCVVIALLLRTANANSPCPLIVTDITEYCESAWSMDEGGSMAAPFKTPDDGHTRSLTNVSMMIGQDQSTTGTGDISIHLNNKGVPGTKVADVITGFLLPQEADHDGIPATITATDIWLLPNTEYWLVVWCPNAGCTWCGNTVRHNVGGDGTIVDGLAIETSAQAGWVHETNHFLTFALYGCVVSPSPSPSHSRSPSRSKSKSRSPSKGFKKKRKKSPFLGRQLKPGGKVNNNRKVNGT